MPKIRVRLKRGEAVDITRTANSKADWLIATFGLRKAYVISRLTHEKVFAVYKKMEKKYPDEKIH